MKKWAPEMPRLSEASRSQAIGMLVAGVTKSEVARRLNCHTSTISRLLRRYQGDVKDMPKSGRPRTITRRQDVSIRVTHLRDRFTSASDSARRTRGTHGYVNFLPIQNPNDIHKIYGNFNFLFPTTKIVMRFFFDEVYCFSMPPSVTQPLRFCILAPYAMVYCLFSPADRQCLLLLICDPNFQPVCSFTPENCSSSGQTYDFPDKVLG